ncbi:fluoride export protein 2-like [Silene latifolia]|uniref:fluoride export protein 2-like n=1 Tax=Silene latifolia TaxID=37657 RepID=UPI003D773C17
MAANNQNINVKDNGSPTSGENVKENEVVLTIQRENSSKARTSSVGASQLRFLDVPVSAYMQLGEDIENEIVSQAADVGDRELSRRESPRSLRFSMDRGVAFSVQEDLLESYGPIKSRAVYPVSETSKPVSTDVTLLEKQEQQKDVPPSVEYVACLAYLSFFAIIGVLSCYLLREVFGPSVAAVTSYTGILYLGLPANMVGSFLMGWLGVVFKGDISRVSDQLAIGLTSGYLGSLTAFSGWILQMVDLSVHGKWVYAIIGLLIGLFLSSYSFNFGIETAKGFKYLLRQVGIGSSTHRLNRNNVKRHLIVIVVLILMWGGLWTTFGILEKKDFKKGGSKAQLWLACFFAPFGVWVRWWLASLNGRGVGESGSLRWIPFGTLTANISAVCMMAALAILKKTVDTRKCDMVASAVQFGFVGCLSTVPAFIAEFNSMRQSSKPWRAYAYATITIGVSFAFATLIYSVPVWTLGYK